MIRKHYQYSQQTCLDCFVYRRHVELERCGTDQTSLFTAHLYYQKSAHKSTDCGNKPALAHLRRVNLACIVYSTVTFLWSTAVVRVGRSHISTS